MCEADLRNRSEREAQSTPLETLCGGAGNRTRVHRYQSEASTCVVVLNAFSAFPLSYDPAGNAAQSLFDVPRAPDDRSGW